MKAVLHYAAGPVFRHQLAELGAPLDVAVVAPGDDHALRREIADAEILLHVLSPVDAGMIAAAPRLRLIQKIGVGVDTIDCDAAVARGIAVCNMPGTNTRAVAEHALALMLAVLRRVARLDRATRTGEGWASGPELLDGIGEIGGRTVGLVGYGQVARALAPVLRALGARVVAFARTPPDDGTLALSLDDLLAAADIVSLHLPATAETRGLFDGGAFGRMKRGAILVNAARGALVDEHALVVALRDGRLAGAGIDAFADEPVDASHPLCALPNVVLTPHVAWLTDETLRRSVAVAAENACRLAAGDTLLHRVA